MQTMKKYKWHIIGVLLAIGVLGTIFEEPEPSADFEERTIAEPAPLEVPESFAVTVEEEPEEIVEDAPEEDVADEVETAAADAVEEEPVETEPVDVEQVSDDIADDGTDEQPEEVVKAADEPSFDPKIRELHIDVFRNSAIPFFENLTRYQYIGGTEIWQRNFEIDVDNIRFVIDEVREHEDSELLEALEPIEKGLVELELALEEDDPDRVDIAHDLFMEGIAEINRLSDELEKLN